MAWYEALVTELRRECPDLRLKYDEPMSNHTTFRIGGAVKVMALPETESQCIAVLKCAKKLGITPNVVGNGSNLLVADEGLDGLVIKVADGLSQMTVEGATITAGAGVRLYQLAQCAMEHGLTGLEFASGIPGALGGAIAMNAGAYGGEMSMVLQSVTWLDGEGDRHTAPVSDLDLSYRHSRFLAEPCLILSATLSLKQGDCAEIKAKMDELSRQRREKQPLNYPSGGSTFKRPTGHFAAALIDQCGLKGATVGGAQVSPKHAGFVVNVGGATCNDVMTLVEQVAATVLEQTGVTLELELKTLGR